MCTRVQRLALHVSPAQSLAREKMKEMKETAPETPAGAMTDVTPCHLRKKATGPSCLKRHTQRSLMPKSARRRGRTASDGLRIRGMGISMISGIGRGRSEARPSLGTRLARALKNLDTSRMSASVKMAGTGSLNFPKLTVEFRRSVFTAHGQVVAICACA